MDQRTIKRIKENKAVRVLSYPFEQVRRRVRVLRYHGSEDSRYMKGLKDIHRGESCFVIGNGPSLTAEDLDVLHASGMVCFATNRIYQIYPKTNWRPTYYLCMDIYGLHMLFKDIRCSGDYPKFINYTARGLGRRQEDDIHYLCEFENFKIDPFELKPKSLSSDLSWYGTKNGTVTVNAMELAMYMGFKTIYLLGVDNSYKYKRLSDGTIYDDPAVKATYFAGESQAASDRALFQPVDYMNASYRLCKAYAEKNRVDIYNATRGGKLEIFERVDFDGLFRRPAVPGGGNL